MYEEGISICVTAYNAGEFIEDTLDSIAMQTWFKNNDNWEVILGIDGCESTLEKVREIMDKYRNLKVLMMDSNEGTYVTSNTIMSQARYDWLLRFDSDDIMDPRMVEILMTKKDVDSDLILFYKKDFGSSCGRTRLTCGVAMIKHDTLDEFGGYMPWKCGADSDFEIRLSKFCRKQIIKEYLFYRRIHESSLTRAKETGLGSDIRKTYARMIKERKTTIRSDAYIERKMNSFKEIYDSMGKERPEIINENINRIISDVKEPNVNAPDSVVCWYRKVRPTITKVSNMRKRR